MREQGPGRADGRGGGDPDRHRRTARRRPCSSRSSRASRVGRASTARAASSPRTSSGFASRRSPPGRSMSTTAPAGRWRARAEASSPSASPAARVASTRATPSSSSARTAIAFARGVARRTPRRSRAPGGARSRAPRPSRRVLIARGRERDDPFPGLADSLERLGTETAFSVLARARELERQGREIIHLEIGEPDFDTPAPRPRRCGSARSRAGETHYCPSAGIPELREEAARYLSAYARHRGRPGERPRRHGGEAVPLLRDPRDLQSGRRGRLPGSGLPDLRVGDPLGGRHAGSAPAARGAGLRVRPRRPRVAAGPEDEARDPQLAAEPDRRRALARGDGARRRRCSRTATPGSCRTRSTRRWSTTATSRASRRTRACSSARSCSTASRRRTR